jgi:hypothetical protein
VKGVDAIARILQGRRGRVSERSLIEAAAAVDIRRCCAATSAWASELPTGTRARATAVDRAPERLCLRLQRGCGVRGWGRDGLGTGARGRGARARRALMSTTRFLGVRTLASSRDRLHVPELASAGGRRAFLEGIIVETLNSRPPSSSSRSFPSSSIRPRPR